MDIVNSTLSTVKNLRPDVRECLEHLCNGIDDEGVEESRIKFVHEFQDKFKSINSQMGEETFISQNLYPQFINNLEWAEKVRVHSALVLNNLSKNSSRRSNNSCSQILEQFSSSTFNDLDLVEKLLIKISPQYPMATFKVVRPSGYDSTVVAFVTINLVLKAAIIFKGMIIEWVTVKGYDETLEPDELWTESRYKIFRLVQDHTQSAMLHFFPTASNEVAIKNYMAWLTSYHKLFLEPCKNCGKHLVDGLPPTWRDMCTLEPIHTK